jgi:hypothetical protein
MVKEGMKVFEEGRLEKRKRQKRGGMARESEKFTVRVKERLCRSVGGGVAGEDEKNWEHNGGGLYQFKLQCVDWCKVPALRTLRMRWMH